MTIPSYQKLMLPILRLIADGFETIPSCLPELKRLFDLTEDEVEELLPSGKQTVLANRAHWARNYMYQAGLVSAQRRGHYIISQQGEELLARNPTEINKSVLEDYPSFIEFLNRGKPPSETAHTAPLQSDSTPEDVIEQAASQIESVLKSELLDAVLALTPTRFEQLIVDLLVAMGYGSGEHSIAERIGKSGDGGIDGIINEDALGLDAVYIQAKRYDPSNKVGRPALQAFVGSLTGEGATKGVFVTTSDYSTGAREYVERVQHRIVLINGDELAGFLVRHEIGVRRRRTYVLRSLDYDYFSAV